MIEEENDHPLGNSGYITVFPQTEEEIQGILEYAGEHDKKIAIQGSGSKRGFGGQTDKADILLSLSKYKGIVEHTVGNMTITVKAGTTFHELQTYLAQHQQRVSLDPAWPEHATIGGIVASNESGPKRLGYGSSRDVVIGLRLVYPDGSIIRSGGKVVKNVAGYDMNKLFIGSMGTLGVVSEVVLKLRPLAKYESLVLLTFPDGNLETVRLFANSLLESVLEPVALELLNPALSEKLTGNKVYTLAISFEDVENAVHYQEEFVKRISPSQTHMEILQQEKAHAFWERFCILKPNGIQSSAEPETTVTVKISVTNLDVLQVLKESDLLQDSHNLVIHGHGGLGHGLCQVILEGTGDDILRAITYLRQFAESLNGYLIVTHLPFALRQQISVWGNQPSYFYLLEGIKAKVDPKRILNHKRFVGGI
ncbi:FAD-binding oxidoreductase [Fictibacillus sp. NE201]|uniref:FAD-binding oxidoreductase n=2 Tax=Fictibacillus fluitans TaxID=3058422 RepID=A0ABT8HQK1_9BACL|nr:FAD-binding oxidoreductase [Fictibacillus sp. NE201]MDN4523049.1 FAD-binding oxidoreductase [Fictibacillus sp. NE201]